MLVLNIAQEIIREAAKRKDVTYHATIEPEKSRALISVSISNVDSELKVKLGEWEKANTSVIEAGSRASIGRQVTFGRIPPETELGKRIEAEKAKRKQLLEGVEGAARTHIGSIQFAITDLPMIKTLLGMKD